MTLERGAARETLQARAATLARMRSFFAARGVLEVETPTLSPAAPTDPALDSIAAHVERLGGARYLHTSPEFAMKRLLAAGVGDIYQVCRVYRDGEIGRWHQPEFTMLEWYRLGFDDHRLMDEVEALARDAAAGAASGWPSHRLTYRQAFERTLGVDPLDDVDAVAAAVRARGIDIPPELDADGLLDLAMAVAVIPALPPAAWIFVYDYPASQAALARLKPGAPPVAARFELFAQGVELANGYWELTDAVEQRRRFAADHAVRRRRNLPVLPIDTALLAALEHGLPDCAGVALGFDRLVAVATGATSVAATMALAHRE